MADEGLKALTLMELKYYRSPTVRFTDILHELNDHEIVHLKPETILLIANYNNVPGTMRRMLWTSACIHHLYRWCELSKYHECPNFKIAIYSPNPKEDEYYIFGGVRERALLMGQNIPIPPGLMIEYRTGTGLNMDELSMSIREDMIDPTCVAVYINDLDKMLDGNVLAVSAVYMDMARLIHYYNAVKTDIRPAPIIMSLSGNMAVPLRGECHTENWSHIVDMTQCSPELVSFTGTFKRQHDSEKERVAIVQNTTPACQFYKFRL